MHEAANAAGIGVDAVEEQRIGKQVEIEERGAAEADTQRLDAPAPVRRDVAEKLLDQHQRQNRHRQRVEDGRGASGGTMPESMPSSVISCASDPISTSSDRDGAEPTRPARPAFAERPRFWPWRQRRSRLEQDEQKRIPAADAQQIGEQAADQQQTMTGQREGETESPQSADRPTATSRARWRRPERHSRGEKVANTA